MFFFLVQANADKNNVIDVIILPYCSRFILWSEYVFSIILSITFRRDTQHILQASSTIIQKYPAMQCNKYSWIHFTKLRPTDERSGTEDAICNWNLSFVWTQWNQFPCKLCIIVFACFNVGRFRYFICFFKI